ncbi:hypothetical protein SLEP1_g28237 [Rubroshorea leprosula]|uniref:Uncharacterized protein n=1 Tax=Rubroshorea leprosula TaxID=152421 RepID=A0AAV5JZH6_9ROSI|nr:hypothetical protein SLEP1_g28237 [Rubroshorea leprosula]
MHSPIWVLGLCTALFGRWAYSNITPPPGVRLTNWDGCGVGPIGVGPIPNGFNSLRPTSTRAELKGKTKRGELASLKACRRAGIHSHISAGLLWQQAEAIRNRRARTGTSHVYNAISARPCGDLTPDYYRTRAGARYAEGALSACHVWDASCKTLQLEEQYAESTSHHSQDVPKTMASESSTSSDASDNGGDHPSAPSSSSSSEGTPGREEGAGDVVSHVSDQPVMGEWESRTITGRLSNLRKAPKDLPIGFRFRAALHHEVADCAPSISGYRRLEEMVRAHHIPRTILLQTGAKSERACMYHRQAGYPSDAQQHKVHNRLYAVVCEVGGTGQGDRVQVAVSMPAVSQLSRREVVIPFRERQELVVQECPEQSGEVEEAIHICSRHANREDKQRPCCPAVGVACSQCTRQLPSTTATGHRPQKSAAGLCEEGESDRSGRPGYLGAARRVRVCRREMSSILERQRQQAQSSRGRASGSAQPRQTWFDERPPPAPQSRGSSHRGSSSASRPRAEHRAEVATPSARRRAREEIESEEDEVPLARRRTSGGTQPAQVARPATVRSPNAPSVTVRATVEPASASTSMSGPRIAYPEGFNYVRAECQPAMVQGTHSFVPPADSKRAKAFVHQHGGQVAMIKLMDAFSYAVALYESEQGARTENSELGSKFKQLAAEKASLVDNVNPLQGSEMANRAAAVESWADELATRNNELREELERARAERESGIQAAKEEATQVEERAKKAETDRDHTQHELNSLRNQVAEAARNLNAAEEALNELKATHGLSISMARAQGAEWRWVLHHRPDFPIRELVFFDEEELDEQGKSLAPLTDTTVRLRWDLNEEGVSVWPTSLLEDGEDLAGLPSFDAWVEGVPVAEQEPSSTPPNSQPAMVLASSPISAPASEPAAQTPPTRFPAAAADASMPVDLTDD